MSLDSLRADGRYRALKSVLDSDSRNLHIANPAIEQVFVRNVSVIDAMGTLAVEHGYDPATRTWTDS